MNTKYTYQDIMDMEQRKRAQLINSIGGFKSVCLIGTLDNQKNTNLATFNSLFHLGANPPLVGFIMRPDSVERHTLSNILATGFYTINHINKEIYQQAHQCSAKYPKEISEFDATGLSPIYKNNFKAPYVAETNIQMGMEFKERINLSINNTIMIIGEIKELYFPEGCLEMDGYINIEKAGSLACTGLDGYHNTQIIERLPYARV